MEYNIRMPFTGFVEVVVEADSKEKAIEEFWDLDINHLGEDLKEGRIDHYEYEFHKYITQGNVFYGMQNSLEVERLED